MVNLPFGDPLAKVSRGSAREPRQSCQITRGPQRVKLCGDEVLHFSSCNHGSGICGLRRRGEQSGEGGRVLKTCQNGRNAPAELGTCDKSGEVRSTERDDGRKTASRNAKERRCPPG